MKTDLSIDVDVYAGSHIPAVIKQMVDLANRVQIDVWAKLNGVRTLARAGDDPEKLAEAWNREMQSDKPEHVKYASVRNA